MQRGQVKLAIFSVWAIVSAAIFCALIIPFVFSRDSFNTYLPECEWKTEYNRECPLCGMTSSFYYISQAKLQKAHQANDLGIYLYVFFILNEGILILTSVKKSSKRSRLFRKQILFSSNNDNKVKGDRACKY